MAELKLLHGETAFVDDQDLHLVEGCVWHRHSEGYAVRFVGPKHRRKIIWLHRIIAGYPKPDHRDGNKLNNRRSNLRPASATQNAANRRKCKTATSSKFKGVCFRTGNSKNKEGWIAYAKSGNRKVYQGTFDTEIAAARAYNALAKQLFGEYALLNEV